ncbi:hypothetical protein JB92DRAFT_3146989 [Gautieria morchelliformis]|nr:hypothetical protein JB92DRAFT_3146989 [Gautieria morchelliformis]
MCIGNIAGSSRGLGPYSRTHRGPYAYFPSTCMAHGFERIKHLFSFRLVSFLFFVALPLCFLFALHGHLPTDISNSGALELRSTTSPQRRATPKLEHGYLSNGFLETNLAGKHPILELIGQAERKRNALVNRQSKTLEQARAEYKRRYRRSPPRGFDDWYAFAVDHDFILIDEFDQINRDISPLLALPRSTLLERLEEAKGISEKSGFIIDIRAAQNLLTLKGPAFPQTRTRLLYDLVLAVSRGLPDITLYGNGEDRSGRILGGELRRWISEDKGAFPPPILEKFENPFRDGREDIFSACLDPPPVSFLSDTKHIFQEQKDSPTFIYEPTLASDLCLHPSLIHLHGSLSATHIARGARLFPEFVFGKMPLGSEILLPDTDGFDSFTLKAGRPWSEKTRNKLFWRGLATGGQHSHEAGGPLGWKGGSQRVRAAFTFANDSGSAAAPYLSKDVPVLASSSTGKLEISPYPRTALNNLYADVGLVEPLVQCSDSDGTCDAMRREVPWRKTLGIWGVERSRWKYVLDLDSNGHSADFVTSLSLGSVVLKSTIFPHWNSDWLIPYYHYIPVQQDYSDVYNVMAFFAGPPASGAVADHQGLRIDASRGHDDLAQKIGENAERFARTQWRWEDMQVYTYRLLLEYARLVNDTTPDDS